MKKLSFILILLSVLFLSCSSSVTESTLETLLDNSSTKITHTFLMQKLSYDESFNLIKNHKLHVKVSADGYACIKCGIKYHTNELYSCYIDDQYRGSKLESTLFSAYRTMGYNKAQASILVQDICNKVQGSLYGYYRSLGYEKTNYDECIK